MVIASAWLCRALGSGPVGSETGAQCRFWRQPLGRVESGTFCVLCAVQKLFCFQTFQILTALSSLQDVDCPARSVRACLLDLPVYRSQMVCRFIFFI